MFSVHLAYTYVGGCDNLTLEEKCVVCVARLMIMT